MPCRNGWRWTGPARRGVGTRGRESSGSRGGPLGSIAVEEFAAAAVRAFSIEAITILAQPRLVARLAGEADGGVLAAGVALEVVAELPVEDCPGTSGAFLAGGACRRGSGRGGGRGRRRDRKSTRLKS